MQQERQRGWPSVTGMFLVALLAVDALLILAHFAFALAGIGEYIDMSLAASGGFAERVLQGKWLVLAVMILAVAALWQNWRPLPYAGLAFYFWGADMTDLPVHFGRWLRDVIGGPLQAETVMGIPMIEVLSTSLHLLMFASFFVPAIIAWRRARADELPFMRGMAVAIIALGAFGIVFDVASASLLPDHLKHSLGDFIEDGGELVIGSFMLWITARQLFQESPRPKSSRFRDRPSALAGRTASDPNLA